MTERPAAATRWDPQGHTAVFGAGQESLAATATAVFEAARPSGEALVLMADDAHLDLLADLPDRDDLVASGRLRLVRTADAYPHRDATRLLAAFDATLDGVLADGWTGMRVVADNTSLARGSDGAFADWLRWEHVTHQWQDRHPAVGVCWFDTAALAPERRDLLAVVHIASHGSAAPAFRLLTVDGTARLLGDVDPHEVPRLVDLLAHVPHTGEVVVDLQDAGYLHHTVFAALERLPAEVERVRLVGARKVVRRVWDVVADDAARVELS